VSSAMQTHSWTISVSAQLRIMHSIMKEICTQELQPWNL